MMPSHDRHLAPVLMSYSLQIGEIIQVMLHGAGAARAMANQRNSVVNVGVFVP